MRKHLYLFIFYFLIFNNGFANNIENQLNKLFNELKLSKFDIKKSSKLEQKIWKFWVTHPNNKELTNMLNNGIILMNNQKFDEAILLLTKIIELDPNWAEAWNKRATVLYMIGEFEKSQNDIDRVLELENRHFGALAGQGLVNIQLKNYEKAKLSYQKAQKYIQQCNLQK